MNDHDVMYILDCIYIFNDIQCREKEPFHSPSICHSLHAIFSRTMYNRTAFLTEDEPRKYEESLTGWILPRGISQDRWIDSL